MDPTANLEAMIAAGKDSAVLRFALASRYLAASALEKAAEHAEAAVRMDPEYSAAWKLLGKILAESGRRDEAVETYKHGIAVAEKRGDQQAAKEMRVFLKRLERGAAP